ncbi:hypothetical protein MTO96_013173 [Rhipicephalus appendiculatus]
MHARAADKKRPGRVPQPAAPVSVGSRTMAGGVSPRECPARAPILVAEKERRRTKADPADHVSPLSPFIMAAAAAGARPIITESEGGRQSRAATAAANFIRGAN